MSTRAQPCEQCQADRFAACFTYRDYISDEEFLIETCQQCGLTRTAFAQPASELPRYYGDSYYGKYASGQRFVDLMESLVTVFNRQRVRTILNLHPPQFAGRFLDVGCGRGITLRLLQQHGWEVHGTELSETLAKNLASENIHIYTAPELADNHLPADYFDTVMLWHSLEHIMHPVQTIAEVRRILKPGGKLLLEVPNLSSFQAQIGRGKWFHIDAPRHLYHFTPQHLSAMLQAHGFTVQYIHTFSIEQGFYGMLQTLLNRITTENNVLYQLLKKHVPRQRGIRGCWNILVSLSGLLLLSPLSILLECLAVLVQRGAVITIIAERDPQTPPG